MVEILFNNNGFVFLIFGSEQRVLSRPSLDNDRGAAEPASDSWPGGREGEKCETEGKGELESVLTVWETSLSFSF